MSKVLRMTFLNGEKKKANLTVADARQDLDATVLRTAMQKIADAAVFEKDKVDIYKTPHAAAYIERTVTSIFDDGEAAEDKQN